jgi:glycosyltransferase involved in cell wall biosynthesis
MFVSILVATFNQAGFLSQCIQSLTGQTIPRSEYEIVVVNDGSTDNTSAALKGYAREVDAIITHEQCQGLFAACNTGLKKCHGEYIVRVDSDDWLHPASIERLQHAADDNPSADIITPAYWIVEQDGTQVLHTDASNMFTWMAGGALLRRDAVEKAGNYRDFYWEEYDLYLRMLTGGARVEELTLPVLYHREHQASMTASQEARTAGWVQLMDAWSVETLRAYGNHEELNQLLTPGAKN